MGTILASGILDVGGRNVTIKVLSRYKYDKMTAVIGWKSSHSFGIGIGSSPF